MDSMGESTEQVAGDEDKGVSEEGSWLWRLLESVVGWSQLV